ncbi:hypothetical protein S7335_900 [Synechococcus sp. PCC 7335]|uniref:hypothetical protein n=1 Tax=Synechococcus sp. (strain ATCC 29403 / PCC 7335) TaxID=91464 RepID=UPI00017EC4A2|nr:hypothetical protein [Synechococcus sp. PCC 7335]EDX82343.1 hypothetical protein S7335_900 [Synechococcus sp. PCC 7335]
MSHDNPVRRLHQIITKACEIASAHRDRTVASSDIWASTFKIRKNDHSALTGYAEAFYVLLRQSRRVIEQLPVDDHSPYLQALDFVSSTISKYGFFSPQWGNLGNTLQSKPMMAMLSMTADAIDRDVKQAALSQEHLTELLNLTKALLDDVLNSDLEEDLKSYLIVHLEDVVRAIRHYSVSGSEGLRLVINANIGATLLKSMGLSPQAKRQTEWRKFLGLMLKFGGLLGLVADADEYLLPKLEEITKLLPPGA